MPTTKLFRKGTSQMIKNMLYLVKRRRVSKRRNYSESILGKRTLRILDLLFQLANNYSVLPEVIFRENRVHLQEWSYKLIAELFQHRYKVNVQRVLKAQKTLTDDIPLLNCDEIIDEYSDSRFDRPEEVSTDTIPEPTGHFNDLEASFNHISIVNSSINEQGDEGDDSDSDVSNNKENFDNINRRNRRYCIPNGLTQRNASLSPDLLPTSSTQLQGCPIMAPLSKPTPLNFSPAKRAPIQDSTNMSMADSTMNQTHDYSLRDRSRRISYKEQQCSSNGKRKRAKVKSK